MKLKRKVVALDSDEILSGFIDQFLIFLNEYYGTKTSREEILSFELGQILNIAEVEVEKRIEKFFETKEARKIKPIAGSIEGVDKLIAQGFDVQVITARPLVLKKETLIWLDQYFPNKFKGVHFAFNPYIRNSKQKTKAKLCQEIGAKVLVEDSFVNATDCAKNGIRVLLVDAPWNQVEKLPPLIERVYSWEGIVGKLIQ